MKTLKVLCLGLITLFGFQACDKEEEEVSIEPVTISDLTCPSAVFSGTAKAGVTYNGVFTVPYTGGDGNSYTSDNGVSSTGVTGLSAVLVPGTLAVGSGVVTYTVAGTPSAGGIASFVINFGGQSCTVAFPVTESSTTPVPPVGE
ncbi:hypothetical protein [Emticicia sp. BO119]|uniref:hypothetical protein n=1 Tax=Emticicia sp. BO119 TaxID=2757768 RepID=UPI0015EFE675|nr:hypothetical protein [Emticicia sp. BO119]MBA4849345.1 hypothetical protein [Emticicia sp. BO119]